MKEMAIEMGHHYRLKGDQAGKILKVFNIDDETLLVGGVLFNPETNSLHYTQGFEPTDAAWSELGEVHIDSNAPAIYREQIGEALPFDQLHTLTVRARTAMSHFASADVGPLSAWHKKLFS